MRNVLNRERVSPHYYERAAYVYVRQSSLRQVEQSLISKQRQYDLVNWVQQLGWPAERIVVVDDDQGKSGTSANSREGFAKLVKAVGQGAVGIVVSLEASRLARNSADWHSLIYMCRFADTLIADEHGIYDPKEMTDRMVLGFRGQMSEIEVDMSVHRMVEARWQKARQGEYLIYPPAGYDLDDFEQLVMSSDEAITMAIRTVFTKFDELGTARRVLNWWKEEGLQFPVRRRELRTKPVIWREPTYQNIGAVLHNPIFAGVYAFGRTQRVRELDPDDPLKIRVRSVVRDWPVLILEHHEAYISYEKYQDNLRRLRNNTNMKRAEEDVSGPAREGAALLQGIVRCGHCGRPMNVSYGGNRPVPSRSRTLQYRCSRARKQFERAECQVVGGRRVDDLVVEVFVEATRAAVQYAAQLATDIVNQQNRDVEQAWAMQIEKAEYEAQRAERQYQAVDPDNRTVARTLEARWEARLRELEELRQKATTQRQERRPLTEIEVAKARRLGSDIDAVWTAPSTTNQDRKQLLRAAIDEVQLRTADKNYRVTIVWKGGAKIEREVVRHSRGNHSFRTSGETVDLVRDLAKELDDAQIARVLCKQGRLTGHGHTFNAHKVATLRNRYGIPNCPKRTPKDPSHGPFTADEAAAELGVSAQTIHRWVREGTLPARQPTRGAPWRIVLSDDLRKKLTGGTAPKGWVGLTEAARRLGLSKSHVAHLVKSGKLAAVRTVVGSRTVWRIDVESATCGRQPGLF